MIKTMIVTQNVDKQQEQSDSESDDEKYFRDSD